MRLLIHFVAGTCSAYRSLVAERTVEISLEVFKVRFPDTASNHRFDRSIAAFATEHLAESLAGLAKEVA
jgi:hypothetical protein